MGQDLFEMNDEEFILAGIESIKNNKLLDAEKIFKSLLIKKPLDPEINHFLGITFQLKNNLNEALKYFKKATEIKPDFAEAHKNLGNMFYRLGKINEAEISYVKSIELDPHLEEAKVNLKVVSEQKKVIDIIFKRKKSKPNNKKKIDANPFVTKREVETELLEELYKIHTLDLNETKDIRFGNGKCSSDMKLFEKENEMIKFVAKDMKNILTKTFNSEIYIIESFFNVLKSGSGTKPHKHLSPFDKSLKLDKKKYSLTYYLSAGDQNCSEPGILKLYNPDKEILPTDGTIVIIPSGRTHSAIYNGKTDRVMIGINFYCLD